MNVEIANKLVKLRKQYGYSQEQLAEKIGVSRQAVSKWERSESSPDTENLIALAKIYNLSIDEMLNHNSFNNSSQSESPNSMGQTERVEENHYDERQQHHRYRYLKRIPIPIVATVAYLLLGFVWGLWHPGWLVFMLVPIWHAIFPNRHDE